MTKGPVRLPPPTELKVGDRVRHWESIEAAPDGNGTIGKGWAEYGVVVKTAGGDGWQDCYVAFWGFRPMLKRQQLGPKPYILRYHYTSLELLP